METEKRTIALNRALFVERPLDSGAITVLVTVLHRFTEAGGYELFVSRDGQAIARGSVQVVGELPGPSRDKPDAGAPDQINLDLATIGQAIDARYPGPVGTLATGGIMGFYVGTGTGRYTVTLTRIRGDKKETVLDSAASLPEGDFFAVTFVRPGVYRVTNRLVDAQAKVEVALPKPGDYRPGHASLVQAGRGGFDPAEMKLFSGQSLVFQCRTAAHFVVELVEPSPSISGRRETSDGDRPRYTVHKRPGPRNQEK